MVAYLKSGGRFLPMLPGIIHFINMDDNVSEIRGMK